MTTIIWLVPVIIAQWIVIFYPGVLVFWLVVHNNIHKLRPLGTRAYWVAAGAWLITSGPIVFFRKEIFSVQWVASPSLQLISISLGVVLFLLGVVMYTLAKRQISPRTMVGFPELKPEENKQLMLQRGIYARTRNPLYFGYWLLVLSAALLTNYAASWIMFGSNCLFLPLLMRAEERELLVRYGSDYAAYMRRVPRFFPQLR
jgi:protein-S-isoprenylcysteine O-methyltransferase Ste14